MLEDAAKYGKNFFIEKKEKKLEVKKMNCSRFSLAY
jgi:hypothetical protein